MQYILIHFLSSSNGILVMKKLRKKIVRLNTVILTKLKVKSINYIDFPDIAANKVRGDAIRLGGVYVCDDTHYYILETTFSR